MNATQSLSSKPYIFGQRLAAPGIRKRVEEQRVLSVLRIIQLSKRFADSTAKFTDLVSMFTFLAVGSERVLDRWAHTL